MTVVFGSLIAIMFIFYLIGSKAEKREAKLHAEENREDHTYQINQHIEKSEYTFQRINVVRGIIRVDGKSYNTFNGGSITYGDEKKYVTIDIMCGPDSCFINDIFICGFSTKLEAPRGLTDEQTINFMLHLVEESASHDILDRYSIESTKRLVKDVLYFNELLQDGVIDSLPNSKDFVWVGEPER